MILKADQNDPNEVIIMISKVKLSLEENGLQQKWSSFYFHEADKNTKLRYINIIINFCNIWA